MPSGERCIYVTKNNYDVIGKKHQLSLLLAFIYLFILIYPINAMATGCTPMVPFLAGIMFFLFTIVRISFRAHLVCNPITTGCKAGGITS
jgi:MFS superfamily sulfate permease-like transporter